MSEKSKISSEQIESSQDLATKFTNADESSIPNSLNTRKLFLSDAAGEQMVIQRVREMQDDGFRDEALFQIAKLALEKQDKETAQNLAQEIKNENEKTRCLVHLAIIAIKQQHDVDLADSIMSQITNDEYGYKKYYEDAKQKHESKLRA